MSSDDDDDDNSAELTELGETIATKLALQSYECLVCHEVISNNHKVWCCNGCWAVFHLPCMQYWARSSDSPHCRCPQCQKPHPTVDLKYRCFCGKSLEPEYSPFITPHSCGTSCGRRRLDAHCPHPCTLMCHPGPCPPCPLTREQHCHCGKTSVVVGCSSGTLPNVCGAICGKLLSCGLHTCDAVCHGGSCSLCWHTTMSICHCGKEQKEVPCGSSGTHCCGKSCARMLKCGNHTCMNVCHSGECSECARHPNNVSRCACGSLPLWKYYFENKNEMSRQTCLDPIPTCGSVCGRVLPCGEHSCRALCHDSTCPPCTCAVTATCDCGGKKLQTVCFATYLPKSDWPTEEESPSFSIFSGRGKRIEAVELPFRCHKVCRMKLLCGRHECGKECCRVQGGHQGTLAVESEDHWIALQDEHHQCLLRCGKKLKCGHCCDSLCHRGLCPPCPNVSFTELRCSCGETVLEPPVPCGASLPTCDRPCKIPRPCGHPSSHTCHPPNEACSVCVVMVPKHCVSHGTLLEWHMPCHIQFVSCGKRCNRVTQRGGLCSKACHFGPCDE